MYLTTGGKKFKPQKDVVQCLPKRPSWSE